MAHPLIKGLAIAAAVGGGFLLGNATANSGYPHNSFVQHSDAARLFAYHQRAMLQGADPYSGLGYHHHHHQYRDPYLPAQYQSGHALRHLLRNYYEQGYEDGSEDTTLELAREGRLRGTSPYEATQLLSAAERQAQREFLRGIEQILGRA